MSLTDLQQQKLIDLGRALVDQNKARVLIEPQDRSEGFWFGGGNLVRVDGRFYIVGRYRNHGDSRTGVGTGERGLELAVFAGDDFHGPYEKVLSFDKSDFGENGNPVVSIEGSALLVTDRGVELFVSTEKARGYPEEIADFQKPGTGVWAIDRMRADRIESLSPDTQEEVVSSSVPSRLHVKDPTAFETGAGTLLIYCNHPYTWSSSNTSLMLRPKGEETFQHLTDDALTRGPVWDVAAARVTDMLGVPKLGVMAEAPRTALYFYDGCEGLRKIEENPNAVARPRGYSCEELGGLAYGVAARFPAIERLSVDAPLFLSPHGTACSRYVSTLKTEEAIHVIWQQSQDDLSQPLVGCRLGMDEVEAILS